MLSKTERKGLLEPFRKAGIRAEVVDKPILQETIWGGQIDRRGNQVVQMDIQNRATNFETLRIWTGADDNHVQVSGTNKQLHQAVLSIKEPERKFTIEEKMGEGQLKRRLMPPADPRAPRVKLLQESKPDKYGQFTALLEVKTPAVQRHMLVGKDERFYFIANCPGNPVTVLDAHMALRPSTAAREHTERQGEWFFVPFTPREAEGLEKMLHKAPIHYNAQLYDLRNNARREVRSRTTARFEPVQGDHIAERLYIDLKKNIQLAQGAIEHRRHRKLLLPEWHMVEHNLEIPNPFGIRWVD